MSNRFAISQSKRDQNLIEIPHYAPAAATDLTKDYAMPAKLIEFEKEFEALCRGIIRNGKLDHNNGSFCDALIERYCDEGLKDIDLQRQEHIQLFSQSVAGYEKGIRVKLEAILQTVNDAIAENAAKLKKCKKEFYKGTCMDQTGVTAAGEEE